MKDTRRIRLTLNADLLKGVGALVDIDFNYENLEFDLLVNNQMILEYTVELEKINSLTFTYKNDEEEDGEDRNFIIENIELSTVNNQYYRMLIFDLYKNLGIDDRIKDERYSNEIICNIKDGVTCSGYKTKIETYLTYPITIWYSQSFSIPIEFDK